MESWHGEPIAEQSLKATNTLRLTAGDLAPVRRFRTAEGRVVLLAELKVPAHIQFRRFAGCPICNLHLHSFATRRDEWQGLIHEIVLFHSPESALLKHVGGLPFDVVADPGRRIYRAYGVEASPRALLDPRAWPAIIRSVGVAAIEVALRRRPMPPAVPEEGNLGLPADFLVEPDGRIAAVHYGTHAADQWSVNDVIRLAAGTHPTPASSRTCRTSSSA